MKIVKDSYTRKAMGIQPYWQWDNARLYHGDARDIPLPDKSVHCVVTSPPYWGLRSYGLDDKGIGLEETLEEWVDNVVLVMRDVYRVLRDDGTCWLNLGDAYAGSGKGRNADGEHSAKHGEKQHTHKGSMQGVIPGKRMARGRGRWGMGDRAVESRKPRVSPGLPPEHWNDHGSGLAAKNIMGQPWLVAYALQDDGWIVRTPIVWFKPNAMPESVGDRPTSSYEMIFQCVKSNRPLFWTHRDLDGTREAPPPDYRWLDLGTGIEYESEPPDWSDEVIDCPACGGGGVLHLEGGQVSMFDGVPALEIPCSRCVVAAGDTEDDGPPVDGQVKRWQRVNLWRGHDYYYDGHAISMPVTGGAHARRADGRAARGGGEPHDPHDHRPDSWHNTYMAASANSRNVWVIPTQGRPDAHFATFPKEIPWRCILAGTSERGVCVACGAPWARMVVRNEAPHDGETASLCEAGSNAGRLSKMRQDARRRGGEYVQDARTVDWRPTCGCNAPPVPPTVLDPFVGSGTTVGMALRAGRAGVGVDLQAEYLEIAKRFIMQQSVRRK